MNAKIPKILLRFIWVALTILLALQLLDVFSTIRFVRVCGIEIEENPLTRMLFIQYGILGLWLQKLLIIPFILPIIYILSQLSKKYMDDAKNSTLIICFLSFFLCLLVYINGQFVAIIVTNLSVVT